MLKKLRSAWASLLMLMLLFAPEIAVAQRSNDPNVIGLAPKQAIAGTELIRTTNPDGTSNATKIGDLLSDLGFAARGVRVAAIGDSLTADAKIDDVNAMAFRTVRYPTWLRALTGQRIRLTLGGIFATGGYGTQQIIDVHLANAAAYAPQIAIVLAGTNDITSAIAYDTVTGNLTKIYTTMRAAGSVVIAVAIPPRTSAAGEPAAQTRMRARLNRWIAEYCRANAGMYFADDYTPMVDFATGFAPVGIISTDGTHPTVTGAQIMAQSIASIINTLAPPRGALFTDLNDIYNASDNPTGNIVANGLLAGTSGTTSGSGASGQVATNWVGSIQTPGTITAAFSKEADATGTNLERQVVTLGGTGNAGSAPGGGSRVGVGYNGTLPNLAAGDRVVLEAEVEWSGVSGVNGIYPFISFNIPAGFALSDNYSYTISDGDLPASSSGRLTLRSPEFVIPAGFVNATLMLGTYTKASGSLSGTIKWGRVSVRKVQATSTVLGFNAANDNQPATLRKAG